MAIDFGEESQRKKIENNNKWHYVLVEHRTVVSFRLFCPLKTETASPQNYFPHQQLDAKQS